MVKSTKSTNQKEGASFLLWAQNLLQELNERSQEIIKKRFGIFEGEPETLEGHAAPAEILGRRP